MRIRSRLTFSQPIQIFNTTKVFERVFSKRIIFYQEFDQKTLDLSVVLNAIGKIVQQLTQFLFQLGKERIGTKCNFNKGLTV